MSQVILKWINSFLNEEIDLDKTNQAQIITKTLQKAVDHLLYNIDTKKDLFERQQISSIIEVIQLVIAFYADEQSNVNKLLKFIINICRDIPELENLNLNPEEYELLESELNLKPEQVIQLNFSKYELLQLIEHIEQKYQESVEKQINLQAVIQQQEKSLQDAEHNLEITKIDQQKSNNQFNQKLEQLQQELDKNIQSQKLDKISFEELNNEFYKISQENSQLLQYLQRQQSVIQEQETQIQDYLQLVVRNQTQAERLNNNDNTMTEQQIMIYIQKLEELHQITQNQRREIIKLEIDKSLCEQRYKGEIQSQQIDHQKLKEELDTLKSQIINDTSTRSKNLSSHTTSSKSILAQELYGSQLNQQNLKESILFDENNQLKNIIKGLQIKIQEERECYQRNIEKFLTDLDEQKKKQESDQLFLKQLQMQKPQSKISYTKYQAQCKKLECQVELLKQIIDACLKSNSQF